MKLKKSLKIGTKVQIISGANKGVKSEVLKKISTQYCVVKNVNVKKMHKKPSQSQEGGIVTVEAPVHVSNIKVIDSKK